DGGTLFLDEIGDMPLEAQTRLLRVLQSGVFTTVGGSRALKADVRIVAATHKDLRRLIEAGSFREDLFYRLNVVPVRLPPLRARIDDLAELARHFLERAAQEGLPRKLLAPDAIEWMRNYSWPGNVRELENLMRRLAALAREDIIGAAMVDQQLGALAGPGAAPPVPVMTGGGALATAVEAHLAAYFSGFGRDLPPDGLYERILGEVERPLLEMSLAAARGNQLRAARLLGINRNTLRKKLAERGVTRG
ncbi:MAG: sigma 54-interacting transcriptional regulator, partial [Sphingomonas sp.]